ncbi:MAG: hypothetical protein J6W03_09085 [Bacteroidaceae bacterium]|nr:hypothetical protein [Bacteroidaceae bacterium]
MKQKLYSLFLFALVGLLGSSVRVMAQEIPSPTARWTFNDVSNLLLADEGSLEMTPALLSRNNISLSDLGTTGIVSADGPDDTNKAIFVPAASALKVAREEGSAPSQSYTLMLDIMVEDASPYDGLLQTDPSNGSDGDLFIHNNTVGVGSLGYGGTIKNGFWNRIVLTYRDGKNILYQNGEKICEANPDTNDRFKILPFGFYLFCDEDGEKNDTYVAEVAFWEESFTDEQIRALGGFKEIAKDFEIATEAELRDFADYVNSGKAANGVMTADIALTSTWETPIGIDGVPFTGTFDGQGHKITGFNGVSTGKFGLFGFISNADVKNFSIEGTLEAIQAHGSGAIGWSAGSRISNVHSSLDITIPEEVNVHHVGGVLGSAQSNNRITGCTFSGTLTELAGNNDNFGGVVGYMSSDTIMFCANYGTVSYALPSCSAGGIVAYLNSTSGVIKGNLNMGKVGPIDETETSTYGGALGWMRDITDSNIADNLYLADSAQKPNGGTATSTKSFTAEQLPTGFVCFNLNGDQSEIGWYQTIGTDDAPVLDPTHGQVYLNGRKHCNGDNYSDATYSNTPSTVTQDDHNFVDGFCSYCDLLDENYTFTPNAEGVYEITSANKLRHFSTLVNAGQLDIDAVLVNDIDFGPLLENYAARAQTFSWNPIGNWGSTPSGNAVYKGHFDGQGHSILNFTYTTSREYHGLFGVISTGALIENFSIYGTITNPNNSQLGVVGFARDDNPTMRCIHSYLNINNSKAGARVAGILGVSYSGSTVNIDRCIYSGTLDGNDAGGSGNYGGMVGYVQSASSSILNITNCLFDGKVINTNPAPGTCTFGGFVGYIGGGPKVTVSNSLSIGTVESQIAGQIYGIVKSTDAVITNSFYQGDLVNGIGNGSILPEPETLMATEVTDDELASGEIAWKLNEGKFYNVAWHQTIGETLYPVPFGDEGIVYEFGEEDYKNLSDEVLAEFIDDISTKEKEFLEDAIAYQALLDDYVAAIESWEDITTLEAFMQAYGEAVELKEQINTSVANYEAYAQICAEAAEYLFDNGLEGQYADFLRTYLEQNVVPGSDYPNGSYAYIMDELNLDDEALAAEITFVGQMLDNAIAGGLTPGTEITRLMTNPTFAEGYEGWTVEADGGTATVEGNPEIMPIPEGFNNKSFSASQTLTDIPNGIYMMALNGLFRTGNDIYSKFYAGQLYMNDTYNYFMSVGEDIVLDDDAQPGVNCIGQGTDAHYEWGDIAGWVPQLRVGCSVAFNAGRYQNFCATEVTDSTLTVGVRNQGTGLTSDWLPFGNLHVYYLGTAEEADAKITEVLQGFKERAQVIVDFSDDYEDFTHYPNMSEELKVKLNEAIAQVGQTSDKMALINTFSDLFNQVFKCRKTYIELLNTANKLYDIIGELDAMGLISDDDYALWEDKVLNAQTHYTEGDVTTEEALAIIEELNNNGLMPTPVDGVYHLTSAGELALFSKIVNSGELTANAVLMNDIDFAELNEGFEWSPIGNWATDGIGYKGHFDGQGHTISNFNFTAGRNWFGLFGVLSTNAIVENFTLTGEISSEWQYEGSVAGYARDNNVTIRGIHSYVNVTSLPQGGRTGGILGCADNGTINIERCTYSGTLDGYDAGGGGNYGGIVGYTNNSTNAICNITNCLFDGKLINTVDVPGNCTFGGMVGYTNSSLVTIKNCLSIGTVQSARYAQFFGALNGTNSKIINSYYQGDYINGSSSGQVANPQEATSVTNEQLKSGEVCFKLNGDQTEINWFQTLGTHDYPLLDSGRTVYFVRGAYTNTRLGDVNDDGSVDGGDAQQILNVISDDGYDEKCDINADNVVDGGDYQQVLNIMSAQ